MTDKQFKELAERKVIREDIVRDIVKVRNDWYDLKIQLQKIESRFMGLIEQQSFNESKLNVLEDILLDEYETIDVEWYVEHRNKVMEQWDNEFFAEFYTTNVCAACGKYHKEVILVNGYEDSRVVRLCENDFKKWKGVK